MSFLEDISTALEPNVEHMKAHLTFLFSDAREYDDGLIEIAVAQPNANGVGYRFWQAQLFNTDEIDRAVAYAADASRRGCNAFVGVSLRDPATPPMGRADDSDFYASTVAYVDIDDEAPAKVAAARTAGLRPALAVCTGKHPHTRLQLWWRLTEAITDPEQHRALAGGLVDCLDGDSTVVNPGRVMRLAGSIAWPTKPGRVPEMTFIMPVKGSDGRPHSAEEIAAAYPARNKIYNIEARDNDPIERVAAKNSLGLDTGIMEDGREDYARRTVMAVFIEMVGTTGAVPTPQELFDAGWPQYKAHVDLTRPGRGPDEFMKKCVYLLRRFETGRLRSKQDGPLLLLDDVVAAWQRKEKYRDQAKPPIEEPRPTPTVIFQHSTDFAAAWKPADYLVDGLIQRGYCYSLTSPTGHGKTAVILNLAACIGTGKLFAGVETVRGRVGYFAAENPNDVQARWIGMQDNIGFTDAAVWFCPETISLSTSYDKIAEEAAAIGGFDLIIVDTSQAFFLGDDENSNSQMVSHAKAMRKLTKLPGNPCVVILTHPVKNPAKDNLLPRGGGGFLAEVDGNLTLWNDSDMMVFHHQGKLRGPGFAPVNFALKQITSPRLKDAKGRSMPTVMAEHVSDEEYSRKMVDLATDEDKVMVLILSRKGAITVADIARLNGWVSPVGVPHKSKVSRIIKRLKDGKLVTTNRQGKLTVTKAGKKELGPKIKALGIDVDGENDDDFE